MSHTTAYLQEQIAEIQSQGLFNNIRVIHSPMDARVRIDGKELINLCANNYLGLANHPRLKEAAKHAIDTYGIGPGAVRTIAGTLSLHEQLEQRLATFKHAEAVVTLQSGFTANLATIPALVNKNDVIFSDELNHASIIDACRLSRAKVVRYTHNDMDDLQRVIKEHTDYPRRLLVTDGVFSMDGDIAPLDKIVAIAKTNDLITMVDDAHGEGVLGRGGRGIVDHFDLHGQVDVEVGTMSKAFGVVGGIVAGRREIIDWIKQRGRPFLFSSAMTVPDVAACLEAVDLLESSDALVQKLWSNGKLFQTGLQKLGFNTGASDTPIIPVMLGEASVAQTFSKQLFENSVFAMAIGYPTVPQGKARIRVMSSAVHSDADLEEALDIFEQVGKSLGII